MSLQRDVGKHANCGVRAAQTRLGAHGLYLGIGDVSRSAVQQDGRIVCFEGATASTLAPTKFCKLIVAADQEDSGLRHDFADKAVLRTQLRLPFAHRKDLRIDFAPQLLLSRMQSVNDGAEICLADDQKVDVTARACCTARHRAEDERHLDVIDTWCERFHQDVGQPDVLSQNAGQLRIDWCERFAEY